MFSSPDCQNVLFFFPSALFHDADCLLCGSHAPGFLFLWFLPWRMTVRSDSSYEFPVQNDSSDQGAHSGRSGYSGLPEVGYSGLPGDGCYDLPEVSLLFLPEVGCSGLPEVWFPVLPEPGYFFLRSGVGCSGLPEALLLSLPEVWPVFLPGALLPSPPGVWPVFPPGALLLSLPEVWPDVWALSYCSED